MELKKIFFIALFSFLVLTAFSQEIYRTDDYVYVENVKSVKFYAGQNPLSFPISDINGSVPLRFEFDDLDGSYYRYYYKIVHCDMNWEISDLNESEYIRGYNGIEIRNYENSTFTIQQYTNYKFTIPNRDLRWAISGNYLLVVYDENREIIITRRFMISENSLKVNAYVDRAKDVSKYHTHHSIKAELDIKDYYVVDPLKEFRVTVLQNYKWIEGVSNIAPKYLMGDNVSFDEFDPFLFWGLNEFHIMDFRSLRSTNIEIRSIEVKRSGVDIFLVEDRIRKYGNYFSHKDLNGNFLLLNLDHQGTQYSQYANVHFSLKSSFIDRDVYVIGGFSEWQLYDENKLEYDRETRSYRGSALLKQGVYDYYYALVDKDNNIDFASIEGSWFETENDYLILVYQRPFGGRYDKLAGYRIIE
jgi:hypothetical protein